MIEKSLRRRGRGPTTVKLRSRAEIILKRDSKAMQMSVRNANRRER